MWMVALLACGKEEACTAGFELRDGLCYDTEGSNTETTDSATPPDAIALLQQSWDACDATSGDGTLDLTGCALGVCAGATYADAVEALGEADSFDDSDPGYVNATWTEGVSTWYPDLDTDGVPDADGLATWISVFPSANVTTEEGLGPRVSMRCFVDVLGDPDQIELQFRFGDWEIVSLEWSDDALKVWDYYDHRDEARSDGKSDFIYLSY